MLPGLLLSRREIRNIAKHAPEAHSVEMPVETSSG
jgi:hypothetical protein